MHGDLHLSQYFFQDTWVSGGDAGRQAFVSARNSIYYKLDDEVQNKPIIFSGKLFFFLCPNQLLTLVCPYDRTTFFPPPLSFKEGKKQPFPLTRYGKYFSLSLVSRFILQNWSQKCCCRLFPPQHHTEFLVHSDNIVFISKQEKYQIRELQDLVTWPPSSIIQEKHQISKQCSVSSSVNSSVSQRCLCSSITTSLHEQISSAFTDILFK